MFKFQVNSIRLFKNTKLTWSILYPRYYAILSNRQKCQFFVHASRQNFKSNLNVALKPVKYISNCSLMHTSDSDSFSEKGDDEKKIKKILDDTEFQNILKDFASDFGVDDETNELLEDIRKNIDGSTEEDNITTNSSISDNVSLSGALQQKYKEFSEADSSVIHSYEEKYEIFEENEPMYHIDHELKQKSSYSDLKRGISGVFDLDELIQVLRNESMLDVTSISIPKELHYADFLVLATAKSERHNEAVSELVKKLYKMKKNEKDPFVKIEGEDVHEWKVMDMGNIVLHLFLEETRNLYDIESLWLFDSKYDSGGCMQPDPMLNIIEDQVAFFNSLQQTDSPDMTKDIS